MVLTVKSCFIPLFIQQYMCAIHIIEWIELMLNYFEKLPQSSSLSRRFLLILSQ